jgi:hypothetical protein
MESNFLRNLVRAPSLASNFCVQNDSAERKFGCFGWKVTLCNFWGYYTKYYTVVKNAYKSLIYNGFLRAWLSVNQGFCGLLTKLNEISFFKLIHARLICNQ